MTSSSPVIKISLSNQKDMNGDYNITIEDADSDSEEAQVENGPRNLVIANRIHEPNIQPRD